MEDAEGRKVSKAVTQASDLWCSDDYGELNEKELMQEYRSSIFRKVLFILACLVGMFIAAGISLGKGTYPIPFLECYEIVWNHITGNIQDQMLDYFVVEGRLPRIVLAMLTGVALAVCGSVMQSVMKNPLADPYTTGISSGAGFGATIAITADITIIGGTYAVVGNAFIFALIPMFVIIAVSKLNNSSPTTMIMAGIAIMYIFNAVSTVFKLIADPDNLSALYKWQVGTLGAGGWDDILLIFIVVAAGTILLQYFSRKLNVLSTGDDSAKAMGINVDQMRRLLLLVITLVVATVVSFTGLIGFVGLVAPHIARIFVGSDNRFLIPASGVFGAALLVVADVVGRTIISPATLEVGVITSFIGGPLFLYLVIRSKKSSW
ncbi:MAG: iron ABC transporter permease [archaeon]|nr:iron ABC transporter permease [archaeon]